jgi:hypothetical protein
MCELFDPFTVPRSTREDAMHVRRLLIAGIAGVAALASGASARADQRHVHSTGLVAAVQAATRDFRDVTAAMSAGYGSLGSCVSGPERGAMGIHFGNGPLIEDGVLDAQRPELLVYEKRNNRLRLVAVEFIVIAEQWHSHTASPPVLMGQHFNYVSAPNRYGLPAFYELHVWAWKDNPFGMFVDWNPAVSCEEFDTGAPSAGGGHH